MRKPKFINRPEETTISGNPRKNHRSFNKNEITFLKSDMYLRWAKQQDWSSIIWNFEKKFGWRPFETTIKSFYERKTYQWAWDNVNVPENKKESRNYQLGIFDEYKEDIILALKDPYFGSNETNFAEFIKVFCPKIVFRKNMLQYLRKKYNVFSLQKEKTQKIIATILENQNLETSELYELLKEYNLTFCKFNYYCKKANIKKSLTENGYKRFCEKRKANSLNITSVEVRYNIDGKFYVEQIELPQTMINKIKNNLLKKL